MVDGTPHVRVMAGGVEVVLHPAGEPLPRAPIVEHLRAQRPPQADPDRMPRVRIEVSKELNDATYGQIVQPVIEAALEAGFSTLQFAQPLDD